MKGTPTPRRHNEAREDTLYPDLQGLEAWLETYNPSDPVDATFAAAYLKYLIEHIKTTRSTR